MPAYHQDLFDRIPEEKRRTVLDAAAAEFAKGGFAAANINIVARNAGVSVGSIYKYFGSKENCFLAVLEDGFRELESSLASTLGSSASPLDKFEAIVRLIPAHSRARRSVVRLYNELTGERPTDAVREFCERFEGLSARTYSALVGELREGGLVDRAADPDTFAFCLDNLFMMLQFSYSCDYFELRRRTYLGPEKAEDDTFVADQVIRFIRGALRGPSAE